MRSLRPRAPTSTAWIRSESGLLFSDVRGNTIYQWTEAGSVSPFIGPVFEGDTTGRRSISSNGLTLDTAGNLFAPGPGGVWSFAPDGTHLGTIMPDEVPANVGWGDDGRTFYMTARTGLYRIALGTQGMIPGP